MDANFFFTSIGKSLLVVHGFGTIIGPCVTVGNNLPISHGCIIGASYHTSSIIHLSIGKGLGKVGRAAQRLINLGMLAKFIAVFVGQGLDLGFKGR